MNELSKGGFKQQGRFPEAQGETGPTGNERRAGPNALKSRSNGKSKGCVIGSKGARRGHVVQSKKASPEI